MADIRDVVFSLGLIMFGLTIGYLYRNRYSTGIRKSEAEINQLRRKLQIFALLFVNPIAFGGAIWSLNFSDIRIITLPFLGVFAIFLGGFLAYIIAKIMRLSRKKTGVFVTCGSFSNIGSIGSLVTYILLGEQAVALMPFYKLFETFLYYGIGFPFAKSMSDMVSVDESMSSRIINVLTDKFVLVSILSMFIGLGLNFLGVKRPDFYSTINSFLIPLGTLLLLSSIGMAMKFGKMSGYLFEAGIISLIKFVAVPVSVFFLGSFIGLGSVDNGLPLKVSVVLAATPVAFTAMVPPTIYNLDVDLANTAWFVTTGLLLLVIPALRIFLI
jgi:predicted permease